MIPEEPGKAAAIDDSSVSNGNSDSLETEQPIIGVAPIAVNENAARNSPATQRAADVTRNLTGGKSVGEIIG